MGDAAPFAFSAPQVAARWGVSTRMVYDLCGSGRRGPQAKSAPGEPEALLRVPYCRGEPCQRGRGATPGEPPP